MSTPDPSYRPPHAPMKPPPGDDRGTLTHGFLLGWAVLIGSSVVVGVAWGLLAQLPGTSEQAWMLQLLGLFGLLPLVAMIALIVWLQSKGKPRSAAGVGLAIGSLVALVLLLVAACFGLLMTGDFK